MGGSEILLILLAVLVLFGADKLPEFARSIGKGMREVKKATDEIKEELTRETQNIKKDFDELKTSTTDIGINDINKEINDLKATSSYTDYYEVKEDVDKTPKKDN
jgi:sec-independent protein translocase protein TatA